MPHFVKRKKEETKISRFSIKIINNFFFMKCKKSFNQIKSKEKKNKQTKKNSIIIIII